MAGFFGLFDYTKPGKGVDVDAPPKKAPVRFFELFWRKFSRFILLNLLMFVILLPVLTLALQYYFAWYTSALPDDVLDQIEQLEQEETEDSGYIILSVAQDFLLMASMRIPAPVSVFLLLLSVFLYGPAMCGVTYIFRNFAREEHAWLSDFFVQMKKNFKQGLALGLLELFALFMLFLNMTMKTAPEDTSWVAFTISIAKIISPLLIAMILFMRHYAYLITVTFNLRLTDIIKNSLAFAIIGLWRNILVVVIDILLLLAVLYAPYCDFILTPFLFFSFTGFLTVFSCYPLIHKHMLIPAMERKKMEEEQQFEDPA